MLHCQGWTVPKDGLGRKVSILVLDPDYRRRAAIASVLDPRRHLVLPFEDIEELEDHPSIPDCLLLADEPGIIGRVAEFYGRFGVVPPMIAYADRIVPLRVVRSVREGACGYLGYPFGEEDLYQVFKDLSDANDRAPEGGNGVAGGQDISPVPAAGRLTRRETEVLRMVAQGSSNQQISELLKISKRTVEVHRYNILSKLNARNSIEASNIARKLRII